VTFSTFKDPILPNAGEYLLRLNTEMTFKKTLKIERNEYKEYLEYSKTMLDVQLRSYNEFTEQQRDIAKAIQQSSYILASCYI
jgi:hypothetical protein